MKIQVERLPRMKLSEFIERHDLNVIVRERSPNDLVASKWHDGLRFFATCDYEVTDGFLRGGGSGDGATPLCAVQAMGGAISGRTIVKGSGENRMEIKVPELEIDNFGFEEVQP